MTKIYGLFKHSSREYDDGGSSNEYENIIDADVDISTLRNRFNQYISSPKQRGRYKVLIVIGNDSLESNRWYNDGGGCLASGYYEIREIPKLGVTND